MGKNMTELKKIFDTAGQIIRWESGELSQIETVELFQNLIDTGLAWELQGTYGRAARHFIDAGLCHEIGDDSVRRHKPEPETAEPRLLSAIAREIWEDWEKVNFAAVPYLRAMTGLGDISDDYYQDTAASVVRYFLSNATTWRGETARRVKVELNALLKAA